MKYYCPPINPRTIYIFNLLICKDYGNRPWSDAPYVSIPICDGCSIETQCINLTKRRKRKEERILLRRERY